MRLSWAGKLLIAAIGTRLAAAGLRKVAEAIPDGGPFEINCPNCGVRLRVPHLGRTSCCDCGHAINVT
jgi:hypothetical protein